jgi:hypothetical protein
VRCRRGKLDGYHYHDSGGRTRLRVGSRHLEFCHPEFCRLRLRRQDCFIDSRSPSEIFISWTLDFAADRKATGGVVFFSKMQSKGVGIVSRNPSTDE